MGGAGIGSAAMSNYRAIDSDGHIYEPIEMWAEYIDPRFRDQAPKLFINDDGYEYLRMGGRSFKFSITTDDRFMEGVRGGFDPHARIEALDDDGIDGVFLYPTQGLVIGAVEDPELAAAIARAYNRYLADFCKPYPDRLFGVAMLPMQSIDLAINEMQYARNELGFRSGFLRPNPHNGDFLSDQPYDALWMVAQDLDFAIGIHEGTGTGAQPEVGSDRVRGSGERHIVSHPFEMMLACLHLIWGGVCARFPRLHFAFLESGGGWILPWLDRMDRHFAQGDAMAWTPDGLEMPPSEYFSRQCWISFEPTERSLPFVAEVLGGNKCLWATDYPHQDGFFPGAPKMVADKLPEHLRQAVLAQSAIDYYSL